MGGIIIPLMRQCTYASYVPLPQGCYLCILNTKHAHFFEFSFKSVIFFIFIFSVSFLDVSQNCKHAFSDRLSFLILFCEEFPPCFLQLLSQFHWWWDQKVLLSSFAQSSFFQRFTGYLSLCCFFFSQNFLLTLLLNYQNSGPTK